MQGRKNDVAGERGRNGGFGGFKIAHLADQDDIGVLSQDRSKAARKRVAARIIHLGLFDPGQTVLNRILKRDYFYVGSIEGVNKSVQSGRLSGTSRSGRQNHAIGFAEFFFY